MTGDSISKIDHVRSSTLNPDAGVRHSQMTDDPISTGGDLTDSAPDLDAGVGNTKLSDDPKRGGRVSLCLNGDRRRYSRWAFKE